MAKLTPSSAAAALIGMWNRHCTSSKEISGVRLGEADDVGKELELVASSALSMTSSYLTKPAVRG